MNGWSARKWVAILAVIAVAVASAAVAGVLTSPSSIKSLDTALVPPTVRSHVSAPFSAVLSGTTPGITSVHGDAAYVGVVQYGTNGTPAVKDTSGDTFSEKGRASYKQVTTTIYEADNVELSSDLRVTVTMTVAQTFAVGVVDVTNVGAIPDDAVGAAAYGAQGTGAQPKVTTLTADDLVLAFIGDNESGPVTGTLGSISVNSSTAKPTITAGVVEELDAGTGAFTIWGYMGPAKLVSDISFAIAVKPVVPAIDYAVTFDASGLPTGTSWSVTFNGVPESGVSPSSISFSELNGTFSYTDSAGSAYVGTPNSGSVTVAGFPLTVSIAYTPAPPPVKHFIDHVVVIVLENENLSQVQSAGPYENYLARAYGEPTNYYAICHTSLPDYLTIVSGYNQCLLGGTTTGEGNIADLLQANGLTWTDYSESLPAPCTTTSNGLYDYDHNPFLWYSDIKGNASRCDSHLLSSSVFNASVAAGTLANYSFYTPNTDDDGHNSSLPFADNWLKGFLSPILNGTGNYSSPAERVLIEHTAFFITWDEGPFTDYQGYLSDGITNAYCVASASMNLSACGGQVYMVAVSPYSLGLQYHANATHVNLLSTIEWLFSLPSDGGWDGSQYFPAMTSLFSFSSNGFSHPE